MPTKCETASLTAAPRDGGYHDHNADQLSHSPFLSAASWDSYLESSAASTQHGPQPLDLAQPFGDAIRRDLGEEGQVSEGGLVGAAG